jgi:hypothetical protein
LAGRGEEGKKGGIRDVNKNKKKIMKNRKREGSP